MPFLEVLAAGGPLSARGKAASAMTASLAEAYGISPSIITTYFVELAEGGYSHAGKSEQMVENSRIFLKVHAFPRPVEKRREAAEVLTQSLVEAYGVRPDLVAVYFLDRQPSEVAHGGVLADG